MSNQVEQLRIRLPWPPSANRNWKYVKGRVFRSKEAIAYISQVKKLWFLYRKQFINPIFIEINAYQPDKRRRDIDNIQKITFDSLEQAGFLINDSIIKRLSIDMQQFDEKKDGFLDVFIKEIK